MKTFAFVGTFSNVGPLGLDRVGQKVQFTDQQYCDLIRANVALIPLSDFEAVGFTPEELAAYGPGGKQSLCPQSFREKLGRARQVFLDIRARVVQGDPADFILSSVADVEDGQEDEEDE